MPLNPIPKLSVVVLLGAITAVCNGVLGDDSSGAPSWCDGAPRLTPTFVQPNPSGLDYQEYAANGLQMDAICLPEAWEFMQERWQGLTNPARWPIVVVIDDGFFASDDSTIRPDIRPGYPDGDLFHPDGTINHPDGTAWGDTSGPVAAFGHHGTAVLSLMASTSNNALLLSGACGPWDNVDNGGKRGAIFLPVRIGRGILARPTTGLLSEIFEGVVFSLNQIRVVNISKTLVDQNPKANSSLEANLRWADARQVVVVTGAGNEHGTVESDRWVRQFENVIVVGALNDHGNELWLLDANNGTATGPGVDVYAPGENFRVIMVDRWTTLDSGTSYAAPLVSCVVAMMLNVDPTLAPWTVRDILVKSADSVKVSGGVGGVRRVNAYRAVSCVAALQQSITGGVGGLPVVRRWSCSLGSVGFNGSRVGF